MGIINLNFTMKSYLALAAIASVSADCTCLETEANGMPPSSMFTDKGYPEGYGASCSEWDKDDASCQEGQANYGLDWCTEKWGYVAAENTCDPAAYDTVFFADTVYAGTLKFAVTACLETATETATESPTDADAAGSAALYASSAAFVAAVAASL